MPLELLYTNYYFNFKTNAAILVQHLMKQLAALNATLNIKIKIKSNLNGKRSTFNKGVKYVIACMLSF